MALLSHWQNIFLPNSPSIIMGILNVTSDSFSDGGLFLDTESALNHAFEMEKEGADIIDIGGESTRPGAEPVLVDEELNRVMPIIEGIRKKSDICISIDTTKSDVAEQSIDAGADIINDISGLQFDENMIHVANIKNVPVIIMHIKGTPQNMQTNPHYVNVMNDVLAYFQGRIDFCLQHGIERDNIILDPGIGFGKRDKDNFELIRLLHQICELGQPVLVGPSRKSFIGRTLNLPEHERIEGTAAAVSASIMNGAKILRVHDVKEMKRVAVIADHIRGVA